MRKSITQSHGYGCGLACVAFVARVEYAQVIEISDEVRAVARGFYCKQLIQLLYSYGYSGSFKHLKRSMIYKNKIYRDNTIVFIRRSKSHPAGHYLVRHQGFWMDPWLNFTADKQIRNARSGYRRRLPGQPLYAIFTKRITSEWL